MSGLCPTTLTISSDAIAHNFRLIREKLGGKAGVAAVVKANAYGHGVIEIARRLAQEGADLLAVANADEAVLLRDAGIHAPILVLGGSTPAGAKAMVGYKVAQTVFDIETLQALQAEAERLDTTAEAHLKIDTGMTRAGVKGDKALDDLLAHWADCPRVTMRAVFTHFASADDDAEFTKEQDRRFAQAAERVHKHGFKPYLHAANSDAFARYPELWYDMVRPGLAIYGGMSSTLPGTLPAQRLTTRPVRLTWAQPGDTVSYGRTFAAQRETLVMTLPIGYGDGYRRSLSNRAQVLVRGRRAPVIGRVCMDQIMADVTDIPGAAMGDEVVLLGAQGDDRITPEEMAVWCGTIPYEIMTGLGLRTVKKVFE